MDFPTRIPFVDALGFELLHFEGGQAEIAVELRAEQLNSWGVAHGGLTMTLLDVVMAHAARSPPQAGTASGMSVVTVEMKTSFLRPGEGRLHARGRLLHRTASLAFCEGSVAGGDGQLVATASGTFKYLAGLPAGARKIRRPGASD